MIAPLLKAPRVEDEPVQLCAFRIGDEEYVIDIMRVEEILSVPAIKHAFSRAR